DWFYRRLGRDVALAIGRGASLGWQSIATGGSRAARRIAGTLEHYHSPDSVLARTWPTGAMAFWTTVMLAAYLLLSYV
ncbi:MAG TPA: hypothetical protein VN240_11385, partial [Propylenella sp.]|nr:hypothetical protein [Propylenella sp.]